MGYLTFVRWLLETAFKVQMSTLTKIRAEKTVSKPSAFTTPKPPKQVMIVIEMGHIQWISIACLLKGVEAKTSQLKFVCCISQLLSTGTLNSCVTPYD